MKKNSFISLLFSIAVAIIFASSMFFITDETEQSVIFQYGEPVKVIKDAGIHTKIPFVQNVIHFDKRLQELNIESKNIITEDQQNVNIIFSVKYKIVDPIAYYNTSINQNELKDKINNIFDLISKNILNKNSLKNIISNNYNNIIEEIKKYLNSQTTDFGIDIINVDIQKIILSDTTLQNIYKDIKLNIELEKIKIELDNDKKIQEIKHETDKEKFSILSEAKKIAQTITNDGNIEANKIYLKSYSKDKEFFEFYKKMKLYEKNLTKDNINFVLLLEDKI